MCMNLEGIILSEINHTEKNIELSHMVGPRGGGGLVKGEVLVKEYNVEFM